MARWIGTKQEEKAETYLRKAGLKSVARNVIYRGSEIDLVMRDSEYWVCVEVKYRQRNTHGSAAETITAAKIHRMSTAFHRYLSNNGINPNMTPIRLDAVVIDGDHIEWLKNISI